MVKTLVIHFTLLLLAVCHVYSQPFRPIQANGAKFRVEQRVWDFGPPNNHTFSFHLMTGGDTVVNSLDVIKFIVGGSFETCHCSIGGAPSTLCTPYFSWPEVFMFQDTTSGKIYWTVPGDSLHLVYDFSKTIGDTIIAQWPDPWWGSSYQTAIHVVDSVGAVTFADGIPRKVLYLTSDWGSMYGTNFKHQWVEGIGDLYKGFIPLYDHTGSEPFVGSRATCYQEDGMDLSPGYPSACYSGFPCDNLVGIPAPAITQVFTISTSADGELIVNGLHSTSAFTISSIEGKSMLTGTLNSNGTIAGSGSLPSGIYMVTMTSFSGDAQYAKWVKCF